MNDNDNKIDILITRHLGKQLDRHVGRAQKAFLAEVNQQVTQRRRFYIPRYWAVAAILLIAATLAGFFAIKNLFVAPNKNEIVLPANLPEAAPQPLKPIAQSVA